ncbi:hypothetical protein H5410_026819 [Solanum commersonii]|uniref:PPM-type phosphatase domain-containing protein n=1 Tax=Solanum commersonii TaxID=4109 RepID=A0A9J5Z066_SOLCO|nr:hypothetical protein H5410_026819 [Solanum commersonii]
MSKYLCYFFLLQRGNYYLKPYVISTPNITFVKTNVDDECLILPSDGLWDVVSSETVCQVARVGSNYLKPYVISNLGITFVKRNLDDECLILPSDGL